MNNPQAKIIAACQKREPVRSLRKLFGYNHSRRVDFGGYSVLQLAKLIKKLAKRKP